MASLALLAGCQGVTQGSGVKPGGSILSASHSTLSFGNVQQGKSSELSETLTNTGTSEITISAVAVSPKAYSMNGINTPTSLPPKQSLTFSVTFSPTSAVSIPGSISITSDAQNPKLNIALSGTGTAKGQLSVAPSSLNFGSVPVGKTGSLSGSLTASGASVTVSGATIDSNEFVFSGISLPATLNAGQTSAFKVTFQPSTPGAVSAQLSFSSDSANDTVQTLTGTGQAAQQHQVDLTWKASAANDVIGYNIYRGGVSGGPYSKVNGALETTTAYTDSSVSSGQTYYYVATAVDQSGNESSYSNQAKAVIPDP